MIPDDVAKLVECIPLKRYLDLYKETDAAVHNRIQRKHWKLGVEVLRPVGGGTWIDLKAVNEWARRGRPEG